MKPMLKIIMNGKVYETSAACLSELLVEADFLDKTVATALNSSFVPVGARSSIILKSGDQVEILAPMQGG